MNTEKITGAGCYYMVVGVLTLLVLGAVPEYWQGVAWVALVLGLVPAVYELTVAVIGGCDCE